MFRRLSEPASPRGSTTRYSPSSIDDFRAEGSQLGILQRTRIDLVLLEAMNNTSQVGVATLPAPLRTFAGANRELCALPYQVTVHCRFPRWLHLDRGINQLRDHPRDE